MRKVNQGARGAIDLSSPQALITLFAGRKNLSTVLHEGSHFFLNNLAEAAQLENAPQWVKEAWAKLQKRYGFEGYSVPKAAHEDFARQGEAYFREGKAPSRELETAFQQFRYWLARIYRSLKRLLGVDQLDPELRDIFDRLLATDEELQAMRLSRENTQTIPSLMENAGEELRARYRQARENAQTRTEKALLARRLGEQRKFENIFRQAAREELANEPFYRAEEETRAAGGFNWQGVLEYIDEDLAWALREKWEEAGRKALFSDQGTVDFLDAALDAGFDSPMNYAGALLERPTRREAVQQMVNDAVKEWEAGYDPAQTYNLAMDEVLSIELEALTGEKQPPASALQAELERRIGIRKGSEADAEYEALKASLRKQNGILAPLVEEYENARAAAVQEAHEAGVLAGEMHQGAKAAAQLSTAQVNLAQERLKRQEQLSEAQEKAAKQLAAARQQERLKRQALAAAYKARQERVRLIQGIRRDAASKSVPYAFKQQILVLVAHWRGLGTNAAAMQPADYRAVPSLEEFAQGYSNLFDEGLALFPEWLTGLTQLEPGRFLAGELSLDQVRDIRQTVKILAHQGRNYDKFLAFGQQVKITEAAGECMTPMNGLTEKHYISHDDQTNFTGKMRGALRGLLTALKAARYVFDAADGYSNIGGPKGQAGPNHKYVIDVLQRCLDDELALKRQLSDLMTAVLQPFIGKDLRQGFVIEDVPLTDEVKRLWGNGMFTKEKVIAAVLNMGNEGNLKALRAGYGWNDEHLKAIAARLTAEELSAVQATWDAIDGLYPLINAAYRQLNGVDLLRVEAKAFTVTSSDGKTVQLRGGYYPLIFDRQLNKQAAKNESLDTLNRMEGVLRSAKPKSGMTKERQGGKLPPRLAIGIIQQHLLDSIHYATHAVGLRDINQLFNLPEYEAAFIRAMGQEAYDALLPWLRHIARPEGPVLDGVESAVDWLARRGTLYAMGLNFKSALLQLTSVGSSWMQIGVGPFMSGAFQMITRPREAFQEVNAKSAYMQSRGMLLDASLAKELDHLAPAGAKGITVNGKFYTLSDLHNASFAFI
ncbi:MAG: hypothetical protein LBM64_05300, partial [Deltaproteobacteria bacterium]|nr:hypothetical protein [Deltaproteobacteria bacterium]